MSRGPRYFEVDVDVSSSSVAANIVGLVQGLTKSLCVDMAICLEGHSPEELPESLLGTVRCSRLDLHSAKLLDTTTGAPSIYQPCEESSAIMRTFFLFLLPRFWSNVDRRTYVNGKCEQLCQTEPTIAKA